MRTFVRCFLCSAVLVGQMSCHDDEDAPDKAPSEEAVTKVSPAGVKQMAPPLPLDAPPKDAAAAGGGTAYKVLVSNRAGARPGPADTVLVHYTGWIQRTGTTFFSTRSENEPISVSLAHSLPGFASTLPRLHKGEKAVLWVPPSRGTPEAVVYEVELVDIVAPAKPMKPPRAG
jgi:hypothetical protein